MGSRTPGCSTAQRGRAGPEWLDPGEQVQKAASLGGADGWRPQGKMTRWQA